MASAVNEVETYFGRCRCCLNYGYLKNMWEEHIFNGKKEIYVQMLVQCFALSWDSEAAVEQDQICDTCIKRLRDASEFKQMVLDSQDELLTQLGEEFEVPVKVKQEIDYTLSYKGTADSASPTGEMYIDDPDDPDYVAQEDPDYVDQDDPDVDQDDASDMQYEEVEYLDDEDNKAAILALESQKPERRTKTARPNYEGKWPKKLPKSERYKTYKQYTEEDLRNCLEEVRSEKLTPLEASAKYNIPRKTICAKVKQGPSESLNAEKTINKEKMFQLIQELKTILTYTNATPFKSKANRYYCAYCTGASTHYDDADELRTHTRTKHVIDRTQKIEYAMRPHWMNETIKLDIENLLCVVCCLPISTWNDMFKHLKEQHKIILDQAYTRAIPYLLKNEIKCALCKEPFSNFMLIDGHMNAHYNNYVCDDCGDTFLSANRLKQHMKIHAIGKFPCSICPKVFSLDKYKKKHEELVHKHTSKFKCWYCDERFSGEYLRHVHIVERHHEKVKIITCEFCGKTFTWRPYYVTHKRKSHIADSKKFECQECGKKFLLQFQYKEHLLRHTGEKHFPCEICGKKYVSSGSLKHHRNWHKKQGFLVVKQIMVGSEASNAGGVVVNDGAVGDRVVASDGMVVASDGTVVAGIEMVAESDEVVDGSDMASVSDGVSRDEQMAVIIKVDSSEEVPVNQ